MNHIIIGAGPAGVIAAETLRKHAPRDSVTIVGDEREPPYSRMAIPYLLKGQITQQGTYLRADPGYFAQQAIAIRQSRVLAVTPSKHELQLADGTYLSYDKLLIASGSSPVQLPIPGLDLPGVHSCWTLADARAIARQLKPGVRVLQMGAGFIGCIIMDPLVASGAQLTVVEMGDRMVPRMMGEVAGGMIKRWCESKGVSVFTGTRVQSIQAQNNALEVMLSTGQSIRVDMVIAATGVRPNIEFLQGCDIARATGILTNEYLQTSRQDIFAAGDCAQALDLPSGQQIVSAIQPNAADQARVAALNMLGQRAVLRCVPQINVLDTLGMVSTSFGAWAGLPGGEQAVLTDIQRGRHLSLQFFGDCMVGCNSVGWSDHVGAMRGLVQGRVVLGAWKSKLLQDPTLLMPAYLACAQEQQRRHQVRAA